jgi:hypothetical protein
MSTTRAILAQAAIINANKSHFEELERLWDERYATDYGFWRPYVMWRSFIVIWIAAICIVALQGSNVRNAAMNFWWDTLASAATCAPRAIKKEWSSTANGCLPMS